MAQVAVAGPNAESVKAGRRVAVLGGNAVDVALAGIFAALVSEPGVASLGGGAFVTVAPPDGPAVTIDGSVAMPGAGLPSSAFGRGMEPLYLEYGGGTHLDVGPGSVATPGTLVALELAHRRYGRVPWAEVVGPAAELARTGFRVGRAAGHYLQFSGEPLFGRDPVARAALTGENGEPVRAGDRMWLPELGDFLDQVIKEGSAALHRGEAARALAAEMARTGGLVTVADLADYQAVVRPALTVRSGGWQWATNPAPAVGGTVFAAMLRLLTGADRARPDRARPDRARPDRARRDETRTDLTSLTDLTNLTDLGEPADSTVLADLVDLVDVQKAVLSRRIQDLDLASDRVAAAEQFLARIGDSGRGAGAPSTVHVSGVDADGLACAVTASSGYGSGVSVPGTGVWLNNCLGERELNRRGPHALAPGERLVSNMTPTIGRHDDGRVLAIGSPGSDRIATAVLQVVLGLLAGESLTAAIERPRLHVSCDEQGRVLALEYESDLVAGPDLARLAGLPARVHPVSSMFFGGVAAALRATNGDLEAAADGRREGAVAVV